MVDGKDDVINRGQIASHISTQWIVAELNTVGEVLKLAVNDIFLYPVKR